MLAGWLPNMEPPKVVDEPFAAGALPFRPPKGLFVELAGEKSKPPAGGWKALLWLPAPKLGAGKEWLVKVLFELVGWAGGKLFVVLPPKAPPNMPPDEVFAPLLSPPMGAEAPKPRLDDC